MISFAIYQEIRHLHAQEKLSAEQIATRLGLDIKTVREWLKKKGYTARRKPKVPRASKLDPYKDLIVAWLEKHPYSGKWTNFLKVCTTSESARCKKATSSLFSDFSTAISITLKIFLTSPTGIGASDSDMLIFVI